MYKDINPFGVRFPADLIAKIKKSAADRNRSVNAEIVTRMQDSIEARSALHEFSDGELMDELIRRWGARVLRVGQQKE